MRLWSVKKNWTKCKNCWKSVWYDRSTNHLVPSSNIAGWGQQRAFFRATAMLVALRNRGQEFREGSSQFPRKRHVQTSIQVTVLLFEFWTISQLIQMLKMAELQYYISFHFWCSLTKERLLKFEFDLLVQEGAIPIFWVQTLVTLSRVPLYCGVIAYNFDTDTDVTWILQGWSLAFTTMAPPLWCGLWRVHATVVWRVHAGRQLYVWQISGYRYKTQVSTFLSNVSF